VVPSLVPHLLGGDFSTSSRVFVVLAPSLLAYGVSGSLQLVLYGDSRAGGDQKMLGAVHVLVLGFGVAAISIGFHLGGIFGAAIGQLLLEVVYALALSAVVLRLFTAELAGAMRRLMIPAGVLAASAASAMTGLRAPTIVLVGAGAALLITSSRQQMSATLRDW
jgi:hypothetical protein